MKQVHHVTGYQTFDLTECRIHYVTEKGKPPRLVVCIPKTWEAGEYVDMPGVNGKSMKVRPYTVTEWREVEIEEKA